MWRSKKKLFKAHLLPRNRSYDDGCNPVHIRINVQWGDMDAFNHLNNVVYARYIESSRVQFLSGSNWMSTSSVGPIVKELQIRYIRPVVYPATLDVYSTVLDTRSKGATVGTVLRCKDDIVALAKTIVVSYDFPSGKPAPLPAHVVSYINQVQVHVEPWVNEAFAKW